ncbi:MAG: tyrosine-type recombinase/integrase [Gemmatimonadaceae bacterium]
MARKPPKHEWHQLKNGTWCRTLGFRGTRVRLFERLEGGGFQRAVRLADGRVSRRSLNTTDRAEAERLGRELLAALLREEETERSGVLTLGHLWERYQRDCVSFLDNDPRSRNDAEGHAEVPIGFFGRDCDVRGLTEQDQLAFTQKRLAGGIICSGDRVTETVRTRSVEVDLQLLNTMLRWATTVRVKGGKRLLEQHPLAGVKRPREKNPKRPVATWERYQKTRAKIQELVTAAKTEVAHRKWLKLELALIIAEATGRRLGSIRQLWWEDVDLAASTIRWRADTDKKGLASLVPIPAALRDEIKSFRVKLGGGFGGLMFPSHSDPSKPLTRDAFGHWLRDAEELAKLPKLDGSLWHAYRRGWATSRKDLSVKDVAAAGGWKDYGTLLTCYQQADDETLLQVMSHPKKITERVQNA